MRRSGQHPLFLTREETRALTRLLPMLRIDSSRLILSLLLGCLALGSAISLGATSAWLIARASEHPPVLHLSVAATAVRMFGVSRAVMRYLQRLASHRVALHGMDCLRRGIYDHLSEAPAEHISRLTRGDILARAGADVDDVGDLIVKAVLPALTTLIVGVGTVTGIALVSPQAALILALCLLTSALISPLISMRSARVSQTLSSKARADLSSHVLTLLEDASALQVNGRLTDVRAALSNSEDTLVDASARAARVQALAQGTDRLAMGVSVLAALVIAGPEVAHAHLAAVMLAVVVLTPLSAFEGTSEMGTAAVQLVRSARAAVRIDHLLGPNYTESSLPQSPPCEKASPVELKARALTVGWPNGPHLIEGIDLDLTCGRRIAIVGPSGIGKTTLLMTLAGMIPPASGTVTDCGTHVTITAEDAHLFATTVLENLRVARADLTRQQAKELLTHVGLSSWLSTLPDGLDTLLGSGGTTVSGGERRRLLIARALASPAPLLLLDEAAEHLDPSTADALVSTLLGADPQRGILLVTHRLSALENADEIIVIGKNSSDEKAHVVARGSHTHILAGSATFRQALAKEAL